MNHANDNTSLRFLSVCSGIEAASVAWHPLGWRAVAYSEIEKFPSTVLAHHYPDVPNLGDFTKIDVATLGQVDILAGGTPCQAFSVAGLRQSLADARGNLSLEFVRLAHELAASNGLRNVVWENVVGVLSTKDNAFGCFLAGLVGADSAIEPPARGKWPRHGMVSGPKGRAAWRVLDAQYFGVAQRRRRVIVVADFGNGADPAEVLFEQDSMRRHSPPSREAGKDVAPTISARTKGGGGLGTDFDLDGGLVEAPVAWSIMPQNSGKDYKARQVEVSQPIMAGGPVGGNQGGDYIQQPVAYAPEIARCDATREGSSQDYESTTMVAVGVHGDVAHTLKAEGADASEDGTGGGTPNVCIHADSIGRTGEAVTPSADAAGVVRLRNPGMGIAADGTTYNLMTSGQPHAVAFVQNSRDEVRLMGGDGQIVGALAAETGAKQQCYLAQTVAIRGRDGGATAGLGGEVATALRASQGGGDKPHVLAAIRYGEHQQDTLHHESGIMSTLPSGTNNNGAHYTKTVINSAVRRLTPMECERLQGFPDNHTRIPLRRYKTKKVTRTRPEDMWENINGEWWLMSADGPRYKALGNSWAVPKFAWLGARIQMLMPATISPSLKEAA
ncbi:DNA cytosine methyltransferase [Sinorhizobium medicae]